MPTMVEIRCECERTGATAPGTTWTCPGCDREWPVPALPPEQAAALAGAERRFRRDVLISAALVGLLSALPALVGDSAAMLAAIPAGIAIWLLVVLPHLRRRLRATVAALPAFTVRG